MSGHTVIAVPVAPLEPFVRARSRRYDASLVAADPGFGHAHVTLLAPWLPDPGAEDLARVGALLAAEPPPFAFVLDRLDQTADGLLVALPVPAAPFARLTAALSEAYPETPPYAGRYAPHPHLTLDHVGTGATLAALGDEVALPVEAKAAEVQLQWWVNDDCRVLHTWTLG